MTAPTQYIPYEGEDLVSKAMLDRLYQTIQEYVQLESKVAAADGDQETAIKTWMETADLPQAVKLREQIANATQRLRDLAEKNVESIELSEDDREKISEELNVLKGRISSGFKVVNGMIEAMSSDPENVRKSLESIPNPIKSNRGKAAGSSGSTLPRLSATITVSGGNFEKPEMFQSFSDVAKALNCEVADLQKAFAQAAGVAHSDIKTVKTPQEFNFQPMENGAVYTLKTQPKARAPRKDSKESSQAETSEKTEESSSEDAA